MFDLDNFVFDLDKDVFDEVDLMKYVMGPGQSAGFVQVERVTTPNVVYLLF